MQIFTELIVLDPLTGLLKKGSKWIWSERQQKTSNAAKYLLQSREILVHFVPKTPLIVLCDASPYGLGAVLAHEMPDGSERPITYIS